MDRTQRGCGSDEWCDDGLALGCVLFIKKQPEQKEDKAKEVVGFRRFQYFLPKHISFAKPHPLWHRTQQARALHIHHGVMSASCPECDKELRHRSIAHAVICEQN
jgi:hypothetical protein